ncbi:MAG: InlB B-repeat-containing protein [Clostridia bacterium]
MNENGRVVTVPDGHIAKIEVTPDHGYEIESVTIGSMTYSTDEEISDRQYFSLENVEINEDIEISAIIKPLKYIIETTVNPENAGTISPMNPEVDHGSDITFTITPNVGYTIDSVYVNGEPRGVDHNNQIELRMSSPI